MGEGASSEGRGKVGQYERWGEVIPGNEGLAGGFLEEWVQEGNREKRDDTTFKTNASTRGSYINIQGKCTQVRAGKMADGIADEKF